MFDRDGDCGPGQFHGLHLLLAELRNHRCVRLRRWSPHRDTKFARYLHLAKTARSRWNFRNRPWLQGHPIATRCDAAWFQEPGPDPFPWTPWPKFPTPGLSVPSSKDQAAHHHWQSPRICRTRTSAMRRMAAAQIFRRLTQRSDSRLGQ